MDKIKVLMIDDDIKFLELVKLNLEDTGKFQVRTETKAMIGLSAAMIFKPDVIILDIVMADQDGSSLAKKLKADDQTKDIPIIYLSGVINPEEEESPHGYLAEYPRLAKPASTEKIVKTIEHALKK
jgi:DNA-binding response OmpR family regulator